MNDSVTRKEFDDLVYIVENHKHQQYDRTKDLGISTTRYIVWRVLDNLVSQTVNTTFGGDFRFPFSGTIQNVYAYVDTAGTTGSAVIDLNVNGSTILSTKINIDTTEKNSVDASTQPVISSASVAQWDILTVDIDTIQTTPAKGLTVVLVMV